MTPLRLPAPRPALLAGLLLASALPVLSGCTTLDPLAPARAAQRTTSTPAPTPSASASSPTSSTTSSATPSTSPTPSATAAAAAPRTHEELATGLVALGDLPAGWSMEKGGDSGPQPRFTASTPGCADLATILGATTLAGSVASADAAFSGGQSGPLVTESLDALPSPTQATTVLERLSAATGSCDSVRLTIPGQGSSTVSVTEVSAPQAGTHPTALRVTADDGDLEGLELTLVATQVGDVVVSLSFLGAYPEEVDGVTQGAVEKVVSVLGERSDDGTGI